MKNKITAANKEVLEKDGGFLKNVFGKEENKDKN